ncbi:MAG: nitroreductase family protein [Anaerolineales bacterium]|nr:nitroreductase family protein [Anaerolineales bacterium]
MSFAGSALDLFRTRRSIRRYTAQPVPRETVERLLEAARWAPSAHNRQPWRFVVVETRGGASLRLAEAMAARLRADRLADGDPPEAVEQDVARSQARLLNAPVLVLLCLTMAEMDVYPDRRRKKAEFLMGVQSVALAAQNLLLAAHAEGLGACWLCAPLFCPDVVRAALDLPPDWEPQALITLGYPASAGKPANRRELAGSVIWR